MIGLRNSGLFSMLHGFSRFDFRLSTATCQIMHKTTASSNTDHPKSVLFNLCAKLKWPLPEFEFAAVGPAHQRAFHAQLKVYIKEKNETKALCFTSKSVCLKKADAVLETTLAACQELHKRGLLKENFEPPKLELTPSSSSSSSPEMKEAKEADLADWRPFQRLTCPPKSVVASFGALLAPVQPGYQHPKAKFTQLGKEEWRCKLTYSWPQVGDVYGKGRQKKAAEKMAYMKLLQILYKAGYFDDEWKPVLHSREELKKFDNDRRVRLPVPALSEELRDNIDDLLLKSEMFRDDISKYLKAKQQTSPMTDSEPLVADGQEMELADEELEIDEAPSGSSEEHLFDLNDILTGRPWKPLDEAQFASRGRALYEKQRKIDRMRSRLPDSDNKQRSLPIFSKRSQILELLKSNRVILVSGGTGCGKTTQVPQFILEDAISRLEGAGCNIVVTQPRRISAISVAKRIARERFEEIRDTVGFHVRLTMQPPAGNGAILFATSGMLLRKLWENPELRGVSYVIVDEVHERDLWTDFLLIVLKRALKTNDNLRVIMMSASMNTEKLSAYFDNCPRIDVAGTAYGVTEYFLEDIAKVLPVATLKTKQLDPSAKPVTDHKLVSAVLRYLHAKESTGAILCFLPSWSDIANVRDLIANWNRTDVVVCPCHSQLPLHEQEKIFQHYQPDVRKIVLATNIAETSITIDDVRFVVNTGTRKNSVNERNSKCITQTWASQSSQIQRRGRAGRVRDGECYHLFSNSTFENMQQYELPAMLKEPLESVILYAKLCCPEEDPVRFLNEALDPPLYNQMSAALTFLIAVKVLNEQRHLTPFGQCVARFGCHPMLAIAIIYASVYGCVEPLLTLTSALQTDGFAMTSLGAESNEYEMKKRFDQGTNSDHVALVNVFNAYERHLSNNRGEEFVKEYQLRPESLRQCEALRRLFASEVYSALLCQNADDCLDLSSPINVNANNTTLVKAVLTAGLYQQLLYLGKGIFDKRRRILNDKMALKDETNHLYSTPNDSLFNKVSLSCAEIGQLFVYTNKTLISGTKMQRVDGLTLVHPLAVVLFGSHEPESYGNGSISLLRDCISLQMYNSEDADRILGLRELVHDLVLWTVSTTSPVDASKIDMVEPIHQKLMDVKGMLMPVLNDIFSTMLP